MKEMRGFYLAHRGLGAEAPMFNQGCRRAACTAAGCYRFARRPARKPAGLQGLRYSGEKIP